MTAPQSENFYNGVVSVVCVDRTPVVGVDRHYMVCNLLMVSENSDGTYIAPVFTYLFDQESLLDPIRALSPDQRKALVVLGKEWHGTYEDLLFAVKELS